MSIPCTVSQFYKQNSQKRGRINLLVDAEASVVRCRREVVIVANVTDELCTTLRNRRNVTIIPVGMIPEFIAQLQAAMADAADCGESAREWIRYKSVHPVRKGRHGRKT